MEPSFEPIETTTTRMRSGSPRLFLVAIKFWSFCGQSMQAATTFSKVRRARWCLRRMWRERRVGSWRARATFSSFPSFFSLLCVAVSRAARPPAPHLASLAVATVRGRGSEGRFWPTRRIFLKNVFSRRMRPHGARFAAWYTCETLGPRRCSGQAKENLKF